MFNAFMEVEWRRRKILEWSIEKDHLVDIVFKALSIANTEAFGKAPSMPIILQAPHAVRGEAEKPAAPSTEKIKGPLSQKEAKQLVLRVLYQAGKPMKRREIVEAVGRLIEFADRDLEKLESGLPRWEATVRWAVSNLKKEGLIESKERNQWVLTDRGRKVIEGG